MLLYKEKIELAENKETVSLLMDDVLDLYKQYPEECNELLQELNQISNEFDEIEKEMEELERTTE